jgi:hypothetical protein
MNLADEYKFAEDWRGLADHIEDPVLFEQSVSYEREATQLALYTNSGVFTPAVLDELRGAHSETGKLFISAAENCKVELAAKAIAVVDEMNGIVEKLRGQKRSFDELLA